jgi:hypothetical protein
MIAVTIAKNEKELVEQINEALANPAAKTFNEKVWSPCKSAISRRNK